MYSLLVRELPSDFFYHIVLSVPIMKNEDLYLEKVKTTEILVLLMPNSVFPHLHFF